MRDYGRLITSVAFAWKISIHLNFAHRAVDESDYPAMAVSQMEPGLGKRPVSRVGDLLLLGIAETDFHHLVRHCFDHGLRGDRVLAFRGEILRRYLELKFADIEHSRRGIEESRVRQDLAGRF